LLSLRIGAGSTIFNFGTTQVLFLAWTGVILVTSLRRHDFLTRGTFLAVTFNMCILGILAVAQGSVVISGGILDLSLPASLMFSGFITIRLMDSGVSESLAIAIGILGSGLFGLLNAVFVVWGKLNPLIVTLATGFAGSGILLISFTNWEVVDPKSSISYFGSHHFLGFPNPWWPMFLMIVLAHLLYKYTRVGRHLIAVGGNPVAGKVSGISLPKIRMGTFIGSALISGFAGIMLIAMSPQITTESGKVFNLPVISAVVLSGFSLAGGKGSFISLFFSIGFLSTLPTSLVFFGLDSTWQSVFAGFILIIAVATDSFRISKSRSQ
jgi:ribose/xylose/arabinose/galactoside ABC-type transport system permease subunit